MPGGRPTKYDPAMCEKIIPFMRQGFSKEALAGHLGITKDTLYRWIDKYPEFSDAIKHGESVSREWWERRGVEAVQGLIPGFNASAWIMSMKNMHGYRDKTETIHGADESLIDAIKAANQAD